MVFMTTIEPRPCTHCKQVFTPSHSTGKFCSRKCTNDWQKEQKPPKLCLCGQIIGKDPGKKYVSSEKKYCSIECRKKYVVNGNKPNPDNYVTFNCLNCDKEITRYKKYGKGYNKYCSNPCAQKHTKIRKFYAVENFDIVFESSYEAFFWGACMIAKIPVERFDRQYGVAYKEDGWYAPDFYLPTYDLAIEVKGVEDEHDDSVWLAYRASGRRLLMLTGDSLLKMSPGILKEMVVLESSAGPLAVVKP